MTSNSFLSLKRDLNDPDKIYRLRTEWNNQSCNITIFVEAVTDAYCGQITEEQVKSVSKALKYTEEEYIEECRNSLRPELDECRFSYQMDADSFIIRRRVPDRKSMKQIFANIKLKKVDFHKSFLEMFDGAMRQIIDVSAKFEDLRKENESIKRNYTIAIQRLEEMDHQKTRSDEVLYARFLCLLNAKKSKIAKLENQLLKLETRQPTSQNEVVESRDVDCTSSDDSAYSVDTDDVEALGDESSSHMETVCDEPLTKEKAVCDESSTKEIVCGESSSKESQVSQIVVTEESRTNSEPTLSERRDLTDKKQSEPPQIPHNRNERSEVEVYLRDDIFDPTVRLKKKS